MCNLAAYLDRRAVSPAPPARGDSRVGIESGQMLDSDTRHDVVGQFRGIAIGEVEPRHAAISAGRNVPGFFRNACNHGRCTTAFQVSREPYTAATVDRVTLKQARSDISCPALRGCNSKRFRRTVKALGCSCARR